MGECEKLYNVKSTLSIASLNLQSINPFEEFSTVINEIICIQGLWLYSECCTKICELLVY